MIYKRVTAEVAVLSALSAGFSLVGDVAEQVAMTKGAVAQTLRRMRGKGLVKRTNPRERGFGAAATWQPTVKGRRLLVAAARRLS